MKQVVQVRLEADAAQLDALVRTLTACNDTANLVSKVAHTEKVFRGRDLRAITYAQARAHAGLGAQVAQSCIRKVADSYTTLKANLRAGRYGNERVTIRNLAVVKVDAENNLILVRGGVPGHPNAVVMIRPTNKVGPGSPRAKANKKESAPTGKKK